MMKNGDNHYDKYLAHLNLMKCREIIHFGCLPSFESKPVRGIE